MDEQVRQFGTTDDERPPDPALTAVKPQTVLDELRETLAEEVDRGTEVMVIPDRPNLSMEYDLNITSEQIKAWRKAAQDRKAPDGFDDFKFCSTVLANQGKALHKSGHGVVHGSDEEPLSFAHRELQEMVGVQQARPCVRRLYGNDGAVTATAMEVLRLAGYDESVLREADPS